MTHNLQNNQLHTRTITHKRINQTSAAVQVILVEVINPILLNIDFGKLFFLNKLPRKHVLSQNIQPIIHNLEKITILRQRSNILRRITRSFNARRLFSQQQPTCILNTAYNLKKFSIKTKN